MSPIETLKAHLVTISNKVTLTRDSTPNSHHSILIGNLEDETCIKAIGFYLAASVAKAVAVDLRLTKRFLETGPEFLQSLREEFNNLIGPESGITEGFRDSRRNPWIAECIGHLLLNISSNNNAIVNGTIEAVMPTHALVTQQGIDLLAIYFEADVPALCIGEGKASKSYPDNHLSEAAGLFGKIDEGKRDHEIRHWLTLLVESLDEDRAEHIAGSFWRNRRAYLPILSYCSSCKFNHAGAKPSLRDLIPPATHKPLIAIPLASFYKFFDDVSSEMRQAAPLLAGIQYV